MATPSLSACDVPKLIVKLHYPQGYEHVTATELDKLIKNIQKVYIEET